jgi:hypothetical protein
VSSVHWNRMATIARHARFTDWLKARCRHGYARRRNCPRCRAAIPDFVRTEWLDARCYHGYARRKNCPRCGPELRAALG